MSGGIKEAAMKTIMLSAFIFFLAVIPVYAQPSYYVWTDENGNLRFVGDASQIPDKYKNIAVQVLNETRISEGKYSTFSKPTKNQSAGWYPQQCIPLHKGRRHCLPFRRGF